jgi:hypothetical protein
MSVVNNRGNVKSANIAEWRINASTPAGVADDGWYILPLLKAGKISLKTQEDMDEFQRPFPFDWVLEMSATMRCTDMTHIVPLLCVMAQNKLKHYIQTTNGQKYNTSAITDPFCGFHFKFAGDGGMGKERYIQITVTRALLDADYTNLIGTTPVIDPDDAGDLLYLMSQAPTPWVPKPTPSGLVKLEWGAAYTDTTSQLRNTKFEFDLSTWEDEKMRKWGFAVKTKLELEAVQHELAAFKTMATQDNDIRATMVDGYKITMPFATGLGVRTEHVVEKSLTDVSYTKLTLEGAIPFTAWTGIFV